MLRGSVYGSAKPSSAKGTMPPVLSRLRPDPRVAATRFAVVFTGIMGLCVAGLLTYAISLL
jgi:hypothetical protein